jgi:hypothetical protein
MHWLKEAHHKSIDQVFMHSLTRTAIHWNVDRRAVFSDTKPAFSAA